MDEVPAQEWYYYRTGEKNVIMLYMIMGGRQGGGHLGSCQNMGKAVTQKKIAA